MRYKPSIMNCLSGGNQKGMISVIAFIFMITLGIVTFAFVYLTSVQSKASGFGAVETEAFWLAEAGLQKYIYLLKNDGSYRSSYPDLSENLGNGSYNVTATYDSGTSTYTLCSIGTTGDLSRQLEQSVVVTPSTPQAFDNAVYAAEGGVIFSGEGEEGDTPGPGGAIINGDLNTAGTITGTPTVNGTITENSDVSPPVVDYAAYEAIADHVIVPGKNPYWFQNGTFNGIYYVKGHATISRNAIINGTIIADGNIVTDETNYCYVNAQGNNPALVAKGNVWIKQVGNNSVINGLIHADGWVEFRQCHSGLTHTGTVTAGDYVWFRDNGDLGIGVTTNYDESILTDPPPYFSGGGGTGGYDVVPQTDWTEQ